MRVQTLTVHHIFPGFRNGAVKFESVMRLRNKLEELGKMEGITAKEKGKLERGIVLARVVPSLQILRNF